MYDHYIGLEWANTNMVIARMTKKSNKVHVMETKPDLGDMKDYLKKLKGKVILTFEETTTSQWLYTELKSYVDEVVVCDPWRNKLMRDGPKNDKMDAKRLVEMLKAHMLKPVYHSCDDFIYMRKLLSGYVDTVQALVRLKNQRSAVFRGMGKSDRENLDERSHEAFVVWGMDRGITFFQDEKERYVREFERLCRTHKVLRDLKSIPGIDTIGAIKIVAIVVDPRRFKKKGNYLSYCGQIKHERTSGGKSYGKKKPRHSRMMKNVLDMAAHTCIHASKANRMRQYYDYLLDEKRYPEHNARRALARRIGVIALGIMKTGKKFNPRRMEQQSMN